jgi:hypothetical protein
MLSEAVHYVMRPQYRLILLYRIIPYRLHRYYFLHRYYLPYRSIAVNCSDGAYKLTQPVTKRIV